MKETPFHTETETYKGYSIRVDWYSDPRMGPPWKEHDGHGIVSEWTSRDKLPGERLLCSDRGSKQFYDWQATMKKARLEGWGLGTKEIAELEKKLGRTPAPGDILVESVERDFQNLRAWCNDEWHWCGRTITVADPDCDEISVDDDITDSLWGIDSTSIVDFTIEAIEGAKAIIDRHIAAETAEAAERACWETREVVTV